MGTFFFLHQKPKAIARKENYWRKKETYLTSVTGGMQRQRGIFQKKSCLPQHTYRETIIFKKKKKKQKNRKQSSLGGCMAAWGRGEELGSDKEAERDMKGEEGAAFSLVPI